MFVHLFYVFIEKAQHIFQYDMNVGNVFDRRSVVSLLDEKSATGRKREWLSVK